MKGFGVFMSVNRVCHFVISIRNFLYSTIISPLSRCFYSIYSFLFKQKIAQILGFYADKTCTKESENQDNHDRY